MQISNSTAALDSAVQVAMQKQSLDAMKAQGEQVVQLLASAGSVNLPWQGNFIDAKA